MTESIINALDVLPTPWRNGCGQTRELLVWPNAIDWQVRISLADINQHGAFSAFSDVHRWFSVVEGDGVNLIFDEYQIIQTKESDAINFEGKNPPYCKLIDGATRDINLMLRSASDTKTKTQAQAQILIAKNSIPWTSKFSIRALLTTTNGVWTNGKQSCQLQAYDFLWSRYPDDHLWSFLADDEIDEDVSFAWWLGANPLE